jgi:ABC-type multidrug transport system fused ATPase/permease subunit
MLNKSLLRALKYMKPYKYRFFLSIILSFIVSAAGGAPALIVQKTGTKSTYR